MKLSSIPTLPRKLDVSFLYFCVGIHSVYNVWSSVQPCIKGMGVIGRAEIVGSSLGIKNLTKQRYMERKRWEWRGVWKVEVRDWEGQGEGKRKE